MITIKLLLNSVDFFLSPFVNNTCQNMKIKQICHMYKTFAFYQSCCMHEFQQLNPIKNIIKQLLTVVKGLATHFLVTGFSATSDLGSLSNWSRCPTSSSTISDSQRLDHLLVCKFANLPVNAVFS